MEQNYLTSAIKQFEYYRHLTEKAIEQITDDQLFWQFNENSNSIAIIMRHMAGNMLSRFTNFLTEDGEKPWRKRDEEFQISALPADHLKTQYAQGWNCLLDTLRTLQPADLEKIVYIRNEGHTVIEAINRQLAHYAYHAGQIVYLSKMLSEQWKSLSIPRNASGQYNSGKFSQTKTRKHFTDEFLKKSDGES